MKRIEALKRLGMLAAVIATGSHLVGQDNTVTAVDQAARTPVRSGYVDVTLTRHPNEVTQMFVDEEGKLIRESEIAKDGMFQVTHLEEDIELNGRTLEAGEDYRFDIVSPARGNQ